MFILIAAILALLQIILPKRFAFVPLLIATLHLSNKEMFAQLTPVRLILVVGLLRCIISSGRIWKQKHAIDYGFMAFGVTLMMVSFADRMDIPSPFRQNVGLAFQIIGTYLYAKNYLNEKTALYDFSNALIIILLPLAALLALEQNTGKNFYSYIGANSETAMVRLDRTRAQGPFKHPILSGTAGAASLPLIFILWKKRKKLSLLGVAACFVIVISSASSGPLAALAASILALVLWKWRYRINTIWKAALGLLFVMHIFSNRGVWYLMARMDLVGGSTGYHRARLIDSAIGDFGNWWIAGTDYTRHWMFSGVSWSDRHTDVTNYYLHLGVIGGIGLVICLIIIIIISFNTIGKILASAKRLNPQENYFYRFGGWCIGCSIFSHMVSFNSISYFDQLYVLFYIVIGMIPAVELNMLKLANAPNSSENPVANIQKMKFEERPA